MFKKLLKLESKYLANNYKSLPVMLKKGNGIYLWDVIAGAAIVEFSGGTAEISNQRENFQVDVVFSNSKL